MPAAEPTQVFHAQPCYVLNSTDTEIAITELGGHMAPVTFFRNSSQPIRPYYVSPWQDERPASVPVPVLAPLRGDFFCMPFGGNGEAVAGEQHPPHGEIAGNRWRLESVSRSQDTATLTMSIETTIRRGKIRKELALVDGQSVVYSQHRIEGFAGATPLGHHATLAMPDVEGSVRLATSPIRFGMTYPGTFSDPKAGEYQALLPGTQWPSLASVPMAWKNSPDADLTRLPGPQGFADLVQLVYELPKSKTEPVWTTATFQEQGYLWYSLKDPQVLRTTVFWMENHGRHGHPWNGRNNCLGLEDITGHFADGLAGSIKPNVLSQAGVPTTIELKDENPTVVRYIQGVVRIPEGFEQVKQIAFNPGSITIHSTTGKSVTAAVRHEYLQTGELSP